MTTCSGRSSITVRLQRRNNSHTAQADEYLQDGRVVAVDRRSERRCTLAHSVPRRSWRLRSAVRAVKLDPAHERRLRAERLAPDDDRRATSESLAAGPGRMSENVCEPSVAPGGSRYFWQQ